MAWPHAPCEISRSVYGSFGLAPAPPPGLCDRVPQIHRLGLAGPPRLLTSCDPSLMVVLTSSILGFGFAHCRSPCHDSSSLIGMTREQTCSVSLGFAGVHSTFGWWNCDRDLGVHRVSHCSEIQALTGPGAADLYSLAQRMSRGDSPTLRGTLNPKP